MLALNSIILHGRDFEAVGAEFSPGGSGGISQ